MQAHPITLVIADDAISKVRAPAVVDIGTSTLRKAKDETFQRGAGGKVQEKFKFRNAHRSGCHIFADFTVVEVCDGAVVDGDATALPKSEHVTFQRGAKEKVQENFKFASIR